MEESRQNLCKIIIGVCALVFCVLFFVMPLMGGGWWSSPATAWDLVTDNSGFGSYPVAILLLIFPSILAILAFTKRSFKILSITSIVCLIGEIIFLIVAKVLLDDDPLGGNNWIILLIYVGLCVFTIYCNNLKSKKPEMTKKCPFCANEIKMEAVVCQFCGKDLPK